MGRRKSVKKIERQKESYLAIKKQLQENKGVEVYLSAEEFNNLAYPLRTAVKRVGLKLTSGKILRKNNRGGCDVLFFPQKVELYPLDNGEFKSNWENTVIVQVSYDKKLKRYTVKCFDKFKEIGSKKIYNRCSKYARKTNGKMLRKEEFDYLILEYMYALMELGLAEIPSYIELALPRFRNGKFSNFSPMYKKFFEEDFDNEWEIKKNNKSRKAFLAKDIESVLFSATLFSLCKPLFKMCEIKDAHIEFAVQFLIKPDVDNALEMEGEEKQERQERQLCPYWALNDYIELWCDFKTFDAPKDDLKVGKRKFRRNWTDEKPAVAYKHLGFPLVYSNYRKLEWGDMEPEAYPKATPSLTKTQLQKINQASCLPILLPFRKPEKPYKEIDCLTIPFSIGQNENVDRLIEKATYKAERYERHEHIKSIYYKFMALLHGQELKIIKKELQKAYDKALVDIGAPPKGPSMEQQHEACLLGALYYAAAVFEKAGIEDHYTQFSGHIRQVKTFFGHQASASEFAAFVRETLQGNPEYQSVLFGEDADGIYLRYKMYWEAFERYCEKNGVVLHQNALQFRRQELIPSGYIQPQYREKSPHKYTRYDYRKKIEGKEETVLNVSRRILSIKSSKP